MAYGQPWADFKVRFLLCNFVTASFTVNCFVPSSEMHHTDKYK